MKVVHILNHEIAPVDRVVEKVSVLLVDLDCVVHIRDSVAGDEHEVLSAKVERWVIVLIDLTGCGFRVAGFLLRFVVLSCVRAAAGHAGREKQCHENE